jgi:Plant transposon protein
MNRDIGRRAGAAQLDRDYFLDPAERNQDGGFGPTFSKAEFTRRFRMPPELYRIIKRGILDVDNYFEQRRDAVGSLGASTDQKITAALRQLALGVGADSVVETTRLSESTAAECRQRFCRAVVARFGAEHMRVPTVDDLTRIEARYAKLGFPGCIGCLDVASWSWDNCPVAEQGRYRGRDKKPNVRLEVVCDDNLHIWHCFFGVPGSRNDLNILDLSPLFCKVRAGEWPPAAPSFQVGGYTVTWFYWLCDSIYPRFRIFVTAIGSPVTAREKLFSSSQEGARKAVERVFGVLFSRFHILYRPSRLWHKSDMADVVASCCIIHNMIIDMKEVCGTRNIASLDESALPSDITIFPVHEDEESRVRHWRSISDNVEDTQAHMRLKEALADQMWERHGTIDDF